MRCFFNCPKICRSKNARKKLMRFRKLKCLYFNGFWKRYRILSQLIFVDHGWKLQFGKRELCLLERTFNTRLTKNRLYDPLFRIVFNRFNRVFNNCTVECKYCQLSQNTDCNRFVIKQGRKWHWKHYILRNGFVKNKNNLHFFPWQLIFVVI